jgi:hypothetical protein
MSNWKISVSHDLSRNSRSASAYQISIFEESDAVARNSGVVFDNIALNEEVFLTRSDAIQSFLNSRQGPPFYQIVEVTDLCSENENVRIQVMPLGKYTKHIGFGYKILGSKTPNGIFLTNM